MQLQNIFGYLLKYVTFVAVIGLILLAIGIYGYSFYKIFGVLELIVTDGTDEIVVFKALKAIDLVLLGVIFFIIAVGLYELFIGPIDNLPKWFHVNNIDDLKSLLVKVIIVVMGVSFTGRIVTWDGKTDLLHYGLALGAVILVLSYFLKVKSKEDT